MTTKLARIVALLSGGSLGIGSVIAKPLPPDGADVASVFVTNGGYNGVQQVLRLSTPLWPKPFVAGKTDRPCKILADSGEVYNGGRPTVKPSLIEERRSPGKGSQPKTNKTSKRGEPRLGMGIGLCDGLHRGYSINRCGCVPVPPWTCTGVPSWFGVPGTITK